MTSETLAPGSDFQHTYLLCVAAAIVFAAAIVNELWLGVLLIAAVPLVLRFPVQASLGLFAFLIPFDSVLVSDSGTTLNWFVGAATAGVLLITALAKQRLQAPPRAALWWSLLVAWSLITCGWAMDLNVALRRVPTAISIFMLYLMAVSFRITRKELTWVSAMAALGGLTAGLYVVSRGFSTAVTSRVSLAETGPNMFAATMLPPAILAIGFLFGSRSRMARLGAVLVIMVTVTSIFFSMSRGGLIALAAAVVVFLVRYRSWRLLLVLALVAIPLFAMPDLFFVRLQQGLHNRGTGRFDIWRVGLTILRHHGIFGVGLNNFETAYAQYAGDAPIFRGYNKVAHNIFLQTFGEMGILGISLFVAACFSHLKSIAEVLRRKTISSNPMLVAYEATCWAMLVMGLSLDVSWRKAFWLSWILLAMAVRTQDEEDSAEPASINLRHRVAASK